MLPERDLARDATLSRKLAAGAARLARGRRLLAAIVVVAIGVTITLAVERGRQRDEEATLRARLADDAQILVESIETVVGRVETRLHAVAGLFRASGTIEEHEFAQFATDLGMLEGMGGYGFAPLIAHRDLAEWQAGIAATKPGFAVFGLDGSGQRTPPPRVAYHVPLRYFWPPGAFGVPPLGLDLTSEPVRAATLERALTRGRTALTPFLVLLGEDDDDGFLAIHPVVAPHSDRTIGFLTAPIDLSLLLEATIPNSLLEELVWTVTDRESGHAVRSSSSAGASGWAATIAAGGREWHIEVAYRQGSVRAATGSRATVIRAGIVASMLAGLVVLGALHGLDERRRRRDLEAIVAAKDRFLATVSHELRSPLTGVMGFLEEALGDGPSDDHERTTMVRMAAEQAREMADIIDDLITAMRTGLYEVVAKPEDIDLLEQVAAATGHHAAVQCHWNHDRVPVWADPIRVRQIVRNLVNNAFRHGQPPVHVTVVAEPDRAHVEVSDHGPGIEAGVAHRLFEPYQPLGVTPTQPDSLGLGLWVARSLARQMGGEVIYRADPRPTFTLTLPTTAGDAPTTPLRRHAA